MARQTFSSELELNGTLGDFHLSSLPKVGSTIDLQASAMVTMPVGDQTRCCPTWPPWVGLVDEFAQADRANCPDPRSSSQSPAWKGLADLRSGKQMARCLDHASQPLDRASPAID